MGLFRRGTQLLRLGSGLRDCCCRPEKPEECWCPDWCRYYWDWGGTTIFPAREYLKNSCDIPGRLEIVTPGPTVPDSFGFLSPVFNYSGLSDNKAGIGGVFTFNRFLANAIYFTYSIFIDGIVTDEAQIEMFGEVRNGLYGWYNIGHAVIVHCSANPQTGQADVLVFEAESYIEIGIPGSYYLHRVRRTAGGSAGPSSCESNEQLFCPGRSGKPWGRRRWPRAVTRGKNAVVREHFWNP